MILQQKWRIKLIMDWMILYTIEIEELFNGRYRIGDGRRKCVVEIQETMGEKKNMIIGLNFGAHIPTVKYMFVGTTSKQYMAFTIRISS